MHFCGRAYYNLLRGQDRLKLETEAEEWQIINYRNLSGQMLISMLKESGLIISRATLLEMIERVASPEEFMEQECFRSISEKHKEKLYLLFFEAYRRFAPDKPSLSIFCDELDYLIDQYEKDGVSSDEKLYEACLDLLEVLAANQTSEAKEVFDQINQYCAHDLETFILYYLLSQLKSGYKAETHHLLERFKPYLVRKRWVDLIVLRLIEDYNASNVKEELEKFSQDLFKSMDTDLVVQSLRFFTEIGKGGLFLTVFKKFIKRLTKREEIDSALKVLLEYCHLNDLEKEEKRILELLQ